MLRFSDLRLDASSIKEFPDGSIRVRGHLTHAGVFSYRNPDGTERREYRPKEEVFSPDALETFRGLPVTIGHPAGGVTSKNWKSVAIGHLGEDVRQDGENMSADVYVRDSAAVSRVRTADVKHISLGYKVEYDPTPGTTADGQRYDGIQRQIRGNHVALLPRGTPPRGGPECVLRLDSAGDELVLGPNSDVELTTALALVESLKGELATARNDAKDLASVKDALTKAEAQVAALSLQLEPARLDALVEARADLATKAKAAGVEVKGKTALAIKREIVAKRTPALASRTDAMGDDALDIVLAVYGEAPLAQVAATLSAPAAAERADAAAPAKLPTPSELYAKSLKDRADAWKNNKGDA